jgi:hypothetical protein
MVRLWERSRAAETVLGLSGLLAFPVTAMLLGWLYLAVHSARGRVGFPGEGGVLLIVGILLVACAVTAIVHEAVHALAMLLVGHKPRFRFETTPFPLRGLSDRRNWLAPGDRHSEPSKLAVSWPVPARGARSALPRARCCAQYRGIGHSVGRRRRRGS